ncbi:MAG: Fur family transcriptional regulator [Rhodobacteraceae bacterium]|nr:MAG: Fur family transcriptional regulator [Paracoccaceae bacterium]
MPIGFEHHNHTKCVDTALAHAQSACDTQGLKLTPARLRVLEILLSEHKAMGAYDILARLNDEGLGSQPPIVYRALDFLVTNGFVHKIEKLNAYTACSHPGQSHTPVFMICTNCKTLAETQTQDIGGVLDLAAQTLGFQIETAVIEAEGLCPACQENTTP